ncbi:MAG: hypothetical protein HY744_16445 [Deltaproteobacteria bacterium]|nr:hypothetical protein [Deltaproteobacteria bacterium]
MRCGRSPATSVTAAPRCPANVTRRARISAPAAVFSTHDTTAASSGSQPTPAPPSGLPSAVGARRAELLACLPEGQRERPGGTWIVQARLTGTGQMREVTVGTADPVPPAVVACLIEVLERVQIPGHQGPPRTVSFPLWVDAP